MQSPSRLLPNIGLVQFERRSLTLLARLILGDGLEGPFGEVVVTDGLDDVGEGEDGLLVVGGDGL